MSGAARRDALRSVAAGTVAAVEEGGYASPSGAWVDLRGVVADQVAGTFLLGAGDPPARVPARTGRMAVRVTDDDSVTAVLRAAGGSPPCCLVFASARNPGGGFLNGADAQEESVARSSTLWASLRAVPEFYERHRASDDLAYSDALVHVPHARMIRDAGGRPLDAPVPCAFVVAAAPNAAAMARAGRGGGPASLRGVIARRVSRILALAAANGHARLVLGAWGCGVFGNEPALVAEAFAAGLAAAPCFDEVVFAVPGAGTVQHGAFARAFPG